jgi:hypothetical protein
MGKRGEKQKKKPKIKDKRQSERFKEAARQVGADQKSDAFARLLTELAKQPPEPRRPAKRSKEK